MRKRIEQVVQHQADSAFSRSTTRSVRMPRDPLTSTRSPRPDQRGRGVGSLVARREVAHARGRHARVDRRVGQRLRRRAADGDQQIDAGRRPRRGRRSSCSATACVAELEHLAEHRDPARAAASPREHVERPLRRRRVGVVAVVDRCVTPLAQPHAPRRDAPPAQLRGARRRSRRAARRIRSRPRPPRARSQVAAPDQRRRQLDGAARRRHARARAVDAAIDDRAGADVGAARSMPNVTTRPAKRAACARRCASSSALATSSVDAAARLRGSPPWRRRSRRARRRSRGARRRRWSRRGRPARRCATSVLISPA